MSVLPVLQQDGIFVSCANVFLTSPIDLRRGAKITFEVLEPDTSMLKKPVGRVETFGLSSQEHPPFVAELSSLEPYVSTATALMLMREKPARRGVLTVSVPIDPRPKH